MVLAFAGDSTMTSFFGTCDTLASRPEGAALHRTLRRFVHTLVTVWAHGFPDVPGRRRPQLAARAQRFPPPREGHREHPCGRSCPGCQPHLELRSLAARTPALASASALLHGQGGALQSCAGA